MSSQNSRSEQVIEDYKKRKLTASALRRIHDLILEFDEDKTTDRRLAVVGIVLIIVLLGLAYFLPGGESITLP